MKTTYVVPHYYMLLSYVFSYLEKKIFGGQMHEMLLMMKKILREVLSPFRDFI